MSTRPTYGVRWADTALRDLRGVAKLLREVAKDRG